MSCESHEGQHFYKPSGIVPAVILIVFLGIFGLYTAKLLIDFKLNHPNVHTMGNKFVCQWFSNT
jgi:hypothetical protein